MITCYLGLGSNLNHPKIQIQTAVDALRQLPNSSLKALSKLYQSAPAGVLTEQPMYYNAVACLETNLSPHELLKHCNLIETAQNRVRLKRLDARTIDIDILLYGTEIIQTSDLTIPHPRCHLRDFVLVPLLDLWPEAHLPDGTNLKACLEALEVSYVLM
ncbi:MAG: 2-amino-4-hydroxy-6-hydroxymethyldihydropteridine diphosphokinase [Legionella sp.]|nr:2-amino-4-hydroxy-6-hydroxymethyldihydropteridine diphosphokinase [Legionella sp.]